MLISVQQAVALLLQGKVVAIPTETVYGLAASIQDERAIETIYALKNRPKQNPLIIHISSLEQCLSLASTLPQGFDELTQTFWPGPLTLVLPIHKDSLSRTITAGLDTAAFRMPSHPIARELIKLTGPLVAPSANLSGKPSGTRKEHIEQDFGADFPVLEGDIPEQGLESTILVFDKDQWWLARQGAIAQEQFQQVLGYSPGILHSIQSEKPICPGQLFKHYAPDAILIIKDRSDIPPGKVVLGFQDRSYPQASCVFYLGNSTNPLEVAKNLYHTLRSLDEAQAHEVWVDTAFPHNGLWSTIRERLLRAAHKPSAK